MDVPGMDRLRRTYLRNYLFWKDSACSSLMYCLVLPAQHTLAAEPSIVHHLP
jgi:hypothetical protein